MPFHLVCTQPFQHADGTQYEKGQVVTHQADVRSLLLDREHHFVRVHTHVFGDKEVGEPEPSITRAKTEDPAAKAPKA